MQKKIIISELYNIAAIISKNKVEELVFTYKHYQVNSIYIGIVNKIFPSIDAAFVNINHNYKSGFIHSSDIHFSIQNSYFSQPYNTSIYNKLIVGQKILVQILKEANVNKGPRLTTNLSLIGRYLVLIPFSNSISISRAVAQSDERNYLKALAVLIKPATMGLLLKCHIVGVSENVIIEELNYLKKQWIFIQKIACTSLAPTLLYSDSNLSYKITRDFYNTSVLSIFTDTMSSFHCITRYLNNWLSCSKLNTSVVTIYDDIDTIFNNHGITEVFQKATFRKVNLPSGSYIYIETVEAMTVIDVNSGGFNKLTNSKEAIFEINLEASKEIAYQLKIRNISGLIIVDFIDMQSQNDQLQLLKNFQKFLDLDLARPQIVQLSELGLVELTRRRTGRSLNEVFSKLSRPDDDFTKKKVPFSQIVHTTINALQVYSSCYSQEIQSEIQVLTDPQIIYLSCPTEKLNLDKNKTNKFLQFDFFESIVSSSRNFTNSIL
nr:Rne [Erythrocladia irregularis]